MSRFLRDYSFWVALGVSLPAVYLFFIFVDSAPLYLPHALSWEMVVIFVIISPVVEEIVFRGGVLPYLLRHIVLNSSYWHISYANIITSLIFCSLHFINQSVISSVAIFIPSLIFGVFYQRYHHIAPSIILHSVYNTVFLIVSHYMNVELTNLAAT